MPRPRVEHSPVLSDDLARRVSAIEFKPSKGFLKDRPQPKRSAIRANSGAALGLQRLETE